MQLTSDVLAQLTPERIERLNRPGPRYTSYPTVPNWSVGQFSQELRSYLRRAGADEQSFSLYVHLPFCRRLCTFCGCNQFITNNPKIVEDYLQAVDHELAWTHQELGGRRKLRQLHFGGGTPTYLQLPQLQRLWQSINTHFEIEAGAELAIEVHPGVTRREQLEWLASVGFRRLSLGVQDLDPEVQQAINRFQTSEQTWRTVEQARDLGFRSINLDLVYGLPKQTPERFAHTLAAVNEHRPERLAVYSFAYIPGRFRTHERAIREEDLPTPAQKIALYLQTIEAFSQANYQMIGMDHYAVPEDELAQALANHTLHRNFMGYTTLKGLRQLGVGVSAISDFGDGYFQNEKDLFRYTASWLNQQPVPAVHQALDADDLLRREVIETLMCHGHLETQSLAERYQINFSTYFAEALTQLEPLMTEGLLTQTPQGLEVQPLGMLFLRNLAMPFDRYLGQTPTQFSRTV